VEISKAKHSGFVCLKKKTKTKKKKRKEKADHRTCQFWFADNP
jgi:hypothetical protein